MLEVSYEHFLAYSETNTPKDACMHTWKLDNRSILIKGWSPTWLIKTKIQASSQRRTNTVASHQRKAKREREMRSFALWLKMVSVANTPFSHISQDVLLISVFVSHQQSLRKWKCESEAVCIHVWEQACERRLVSELFPAKPIDTGFAKLYHIVSL